MAKNEITVRAISAADSTAKMQDVFVRHAVGNFYQLVDRYQQKHGDLAPNLWGAEVAFLGSAASAEDALSRCAGAQSAVSHRGGYLVFFRNGDRELWEQIKSDVGPGFDLPEQLWSSIQADLVATHA